MRPRRKATVVAHFLQTPAWGRFQRALGREVVEASGDGWSYLAILEKGKLNSRLYCPYGPVIEREGALPAALDSLLAEARRRKVAFVRIEPTGTVTAEEVAATGAIAAEHVQPSSTQRIDLTQPWEDVVMDFKSSQRNVYRNYAKKGMVVRRSEDPADVEHLLTLLHEVAANNQMNPQSDTYLRTQARTLVPSGDARIYLVELEGQVVAASMIYDDGGTVRYYAHAAADYAHRKLAPGTVIVGTMLEEAATEGYEEFDLVGVIGPDAPKDHPWFGFSQFKRSFGGHQVDYAGTWEIPVNKPLYAAYGAARRAVESDAAGTAISGLKKVAGGARRAVGEAVRRARRKG